MITQGKWEAVDTSKARFTLGDGTHHQKDLGYLVLIHPTDEDMGTVLAVGIEHEDNAHLIAAAPGLLAACKAIIEDLDGYCPDEIEYGHFIHMEEAIAKATNN